MLKKWFISAFAEIEKICQNLGLKLGQKIKQNWIFNEKVHRIHQTLTEPFFAFSKDITMLKKWFHKRISWNRGSISKSGPKLGQKLLKIESSIKKVHRNPWNLPEPVFHFFARYYDAKEVIHKRISWKPENISKSGPKFRPKIFNKNEYLMKRCIGSAKPHRTVFRFFERYSDAKEVIHKCTYAESERIPQNLGTKLGQKLSNMVSSMKSLHRIRKTSQNRFSLFSQDITILK